jgi:hypothetical protein
MCRENAKGKTVRIVYQKKEPDNTQFKGRKKIAGLRERVVQSLDFDYGYKHLLIVSSRKTPRVLATNRTPIPGVLEQ